MTGTEQRFEVEAILDKKIINGKEKFKVKWKGFSLDDCTWEPREHFEDSNAYLIDEYYAKISGKNTQEHSKDEESHPKKTPSSRSSKKIEEKELFTRKKRNLPKKDKFQVKKVIKDSSYSDNDSCNAHGQRYCAIHVPQLAPALCWRLPYTTFSEQESHG